MQSFYSYYGSPLHLIIEDDLADAANHVAAEFIQAQVRYREETGTRWTPDQPLRMHVTDEQVAAYDSVGSIINKLVEVNGGGLEISEEMIPSDIMLVKL